MSQKSLVAPIRIVFKHSYVFYLLSFVISTWSSA